MLEVAYDPERAQRAVDFFEKLLVHTKGAHARQPFTLAPFQRDEIIGPLFGNVVEDPDTGETVRQYQLAWLEMGRKNGKSELMAGLALLMIGGDDEEGAEAYGVAKDTDQASLVFNVAKRMIELSPILPQHFTIYPSNRRIVYNKTASFYRVVAADAAGNLGQDPHAILFDEVIAQPNGELWDAMKTGFGSRRQPMMIAATTAGDDAAEFARQEHDFSAKVAEDPSLDPRRFVFIRNLPKDADWRDEDRWPEANPALGDFLRPQVLRDELTSAMNHPREERRFRMFRLNQWQTGGLEGWEGAEWWGEQGNIQMLDTDALKGRRCWGGLVAASATDLAAACWVFDAPEGEGTWALWDYWLPADRLPDLIRRTNGDAEAWAKTGALTLTDGNEMDIAAILARIREVAGLYSVQELAYFAGNALGIVQPLENEGLLRSTVAVSANAHGSALVDWEQALSTGRFRHGANPITRWQIGVVQIRETVGGTPRIDMKGSPENVYGVVAAELAFRRRLVAAPPRRSVYEDRGLEMA